MSVMITWCGARQRVVFIDVDVDPQRVLPDDRPGDRAGPGYHHPCIALGWPAASRTSQLHQVGGIALTGKRNIILFQFSEIEVDVLPEMIA